MTTPEKRTAPPTGNEPTPQNPWLTPVPDRRQGNTPVGKIDYAMRLKDTKGNIYDALGNPLPHEKTPTFTPRNNEGGSELQPKLNFVSQQDKTSNLTHEPTPQPSENKSILYKFYQSLKQRRENPQTTGKFVFDVTAEMIGIPLAPIALAVPFLEPLAPFLAPYTTGDLLNIGEALLGRTLGGKKLTLFERGLYIAGAALPIIPGRALVSAWEKIEDETVYPALQKHYEGKAQK